jgi:hypothetical protein
MMMMHDCVRDDEQNDDQRSCRRREDRWLQAGTVIEGEDGEGQTAKVRTNTQRDRESERDKGMRCEKGNGNRYAVMSDMRND